MERKYAILIVDDNVDLAGSLRDVLETEGYDIAIGHNGQDALANCRQNNFDLALIDIKLPDTSGTELIEELAGLSSDMEYIIITGHASLESAIDAAKRENVVSYETKPLDIDRFLALIRQVFQRKQAEEDREKLEVQLQQSQKMETVGRLAGGIAHDFNNLLTVIIGFSQILMKEMKKGDPAYEEIKEIEKAGVRAASLTRQLLMFSRRQPIFPKVININASVMNIGAMLKRVIGEDIELKTELGKDLENVKADQSQIEQVVMNIAVNARDAMPEGGILFIKTDMAEINDSYVKYHPDAKAGRHVCLTIEDTGKGMDKDTVTHVFEPFFTTKEAGKGTGLGLSVVFGIVRQHGGWINVYSELRKGTAFKIYLPSVLEETDEVKEEGVKLSELKGNGECILLVEDDNGVRDFTRKVLEQNGYMVIDVTTAKEGLETFERAEYNIDLVFSDMVLPDMDGKKLVKELSSRSPKLKYIFCSGYTQNNGKVIAKLEREFKYIQKPYSIMDLLKIIKKALS